MNAWTKQREHELTRLWLEGNSAAIIARELGLGVTRNAVIGKLHRLGLKREPLNPVRRVPKCNQHTKQRDKAPVLRDPAAKDYTEKTAVSNPVPLMERGLEQCCWPLWEKKADNPKLVCGAPVHKASYCRHHFRVGTYGAAFAGKERAA